MDRVLVFEDEGEALRWIRGVQRDVGGPGFPRGEQGDGKQEIAL